MAIAMESYLRAGMRELRWAPAPQRVRAAVGGETVVDSRAARLVWEPRRVTPELAVPVGDVVSGLTDPVHVEPSRSAPPVLTPSNAFELHTCAGTSWSVGAPGGGLVGAAFAPDDPDLEGYVVLDWRAFDAWWEEEQRAIGHPHDPFSRIDCLASGRHVVVSLDDVVLAESRRPVVLLETGLPQRHYLPREDVRMDLLERSDLRTTCTYKGHASYWSARVGTRVVLDLVWTYEDPRPDAIPVKGMLAFFDERTDVTVDGRPMPRPRTEWSRTT